MSSSFSYVHTNPSPPSSSTPRVQAWRKSQSAKGKRAISTTVSVDTKECLQAIRQSTQESYGAIIERALQALEDQERTSRNVLETPSASHGWTAENVEYLTQFQEWRQRQANKGLEVLCIGIDPRTKVYLQGMKNQTQEDYGELVERLIRR